VRYCNAACKKKHRHKHKKECQEYVRRAAEKHNEELKIAAELLHDKKLFKQPPPHHEDCPICFIRLPTLNSGWQYMSCCGQLICSGCAHAPVYDDRGNEVDNQKCPFCRTPHPKTGKEVVERLKKRIEVGDAVALHVQGTYYHYGLNVLLQDYTKALELYHRAGELGYAVAYNNIGNAYDFGKGVEVDKEKARHYYELAAMMGDAMARYNLGNMEVFAGNMDRALKHFMIAVGDGHNSLDKIKKLYSHGYATKEDYTKALQAYQVYLGVIKSAQRDEAAAAYEEDRYY